jgi:4-alpha-glucanotransferase
MRSRIARRSGVLLHPSSFPGPWGIGDLGATAHAFVEFLAGAHQQLWQVLPLGPTAEDGSPYSSFSASAGNPLLVSIDALVADGLAPPVAAPDTPSSSRVVLHEVRTRKLAILKKAAEQLGPTSPLHEEFERFCAARAGWLDDYALFMALKDTYPGRTWNRWPADLATRKPEALSRARRDLAGLVGFHRFTQFAFDRQWSSLRTHARRRGIRVVGDIPFYMAFDSADVWANPSNFALDPRTSEPRLVAGVPPDYFSKTGQLWGNPVYDWEHLERERFDWWIRRFRRLTELVDVVRIDHFRGFSAFWQVPQGETTAVNGEWANCPGDAFFHTLEHELGHLPVWAEDLGLITPEVEKLRDDFEFPGMRVLQFAFDEKGAENPYLPFNYTRNCVCYTGTHDNDTTLGWWSGLDDEHKRLVRSYVGDLDDAGISWGMIRMAMSSVADTVVIPLQDVLGLGADARMNVPGRADGNWSWRYAGEGLTSDLQARLEEMTVAYGRARRFATEGVAPSGDESPTEASGA